MPRSFDGIDDRIKLAIGNAQNGGYGTLAAIVKRGANSVTQNIVIVENSTASAGVEWSIRNTGVLALWTGASTRRTTTLTFTVADGWCLLVAKKDTGTATARFGKYVYSTDTWTWENAGDGTQGNWSTSLTTPDVVIGAYDGGAPGSFFTGDIAAVGIWGGSVLTDAEAQSLPFSLDAWFQEQPTGLWLLDQAATSQKVNDQSGGGANESALTGTTVGTSSVPVFSYGAPLVAASRSAAGGGGGSPAPTVQAPFTKMLMGVGL